MTNQIIVRLKTSTNISSLSSIFKKLKIIAIDRSKYIDREYILTINTAQQSDALDVANDLSETGLFEYSEPDFVKLGIFKTNDPVYSLQWGVENTGQYNGTSGADVNVVNAWNISTGAGVKVAVIDEGVDLNQPDLQANLLTGYDALGLGSNGAPSNDDAHGTACAGIIAAIADNNIGVTGIAYSSNIIPVRVGSNETISTSAAADGINWAASATGGNADILSCSWGGGSSSSSINAAISNVISNGRSGKGCIVLFSSGNDNNSSINYPSNQPNVIAVGGTNPCNYDTRLNTVLINGGSNYGTGLAIVAPGINIATTDISGAAGFSNHTVDEGWIMYNQDYVENFDGTSAACPFAAGVMALILSVNPNLTYSQATAILESTADKAGGYNYSSNLTNGTWNNEMGYGRINACAAISHALNISGDNTICSTSNNYTIPNLPTGATVTWSASPSGIVSINSPNSLQTTLTKITDGTITLTATISNLCGGNNIVINSQIGVGYTQIMNIGYPSSTVAPDELIPMQIFIAPDSLAIGNQKLVIKRTGGGYSNTLYTGGDGAIEFSFPMTGTYSIKVYTYNDCGWSTNYYPLVFFCTNDDMFMLSPNPANTALTVKLSDETVQAGNEKSNAIGIKEIQLTDKMGTVLKRYVYSGTVKQVTMDVSSLKADIYYIKVFNGKRWQGKSFIKQ